MNNSTGATGGGPVRSVAIVSTVAPYPTDNGKSIVVAGFLQHLRDRVGPGNVHYLHIGPALDPEPFQGVNLVELGRFRAKDELASIPASLLRGRSLQEAFTSSPVISRRIADQLRRIDADVVIVDTVRMAQHVDHLGLRGRRVLYLDDLFSIRYARMLSVLQDETSGADFDPLGQFGQNIPGFLQPLTRHPVARRALLRYEGASIGRTERRVSRNADDRILLNDTEAEQLARTVSRPVCVVPPLVTGIGAQPRRWDGRPHFAWVGLLSIAHNHDGLVWFLREGMSALLAERPDAVLHIVGRGADQTIIDLAARFGDSVVIHGFVEDLDEMLGTKAALVNPLRFGTGIKIKTLDSIARGLPVVTTPMGAEGISTTSQPGLRITDSAAQLGRELARLADPQVRAREHVGALRLYRERYAPDVVAARYDAIFGTSPVLDDDSSYDVVFRRLMQTLSVLDLAALPQQRLDELGDLAPGLTNAAVAG